MTKTIEKIAAKMLTARKEVLDLKSKLEVAEADEKVLKSQIAETLAKEDVKTYNYENFNITRSTRSTLVVEDDEKLLQYCEKKLKDGLRTSVNKIKVLKEVKTGTTFPGVSLEDTHYITVKELDI